MSTFRQWLRVWRRPRDRGYPIIGKKKKRIISFEEEDHTNEFPQVPLIKQIDFILPKNFLNYERYSQVAYHQNFIEARYRSFRNVIDRIKYKDSFGIGIAGIIKKNDPYLFIQSLTQKLLSGEGLNQISFQFRNILKQVEDKALLFTCLEYFDGTLRQQEMKNMKKFQKQGFLTGLEMIAVPTLALCTLLGSYFISPIMLCLSAPTVCVTLNLKDRLEAMHSDSYHQHSLVLPRLLFCRDLFVQRMVEMGIQL